MPLLLVLSERISFVVDKNRCSAFCAGAAVGFKLDSLLKLSDTRAANSKMTLMHYLCKVKSTISKSSLLGSSVEGCF